jgi:signal transduction histidine kinase
MCRILRIVAITALVLVAGVAKGFAEERGTREEAKAMAENAARFIGAQGNTRAFAAFDGGTDGFKNKDLYVFAYDLTGTCVSHGANKALIGRNLLAVTDSDGKPLIKEIVAVQTAGWVDYKWSNPQTKAIEAKHAYVVRAGDVVVGVGAYGQ